MSRKAASAIALAACFVFSPMALGAEKSKSHAPAKTTVKKDTNRSAASPRQDWKAGAAPTVRAIPFQSLTTRPASARSATTRPAGDYTFKVGEKYDYFADHYGATTGVSPQRADNLGYVPPSNSSNKSNPFIYRRSQ